jgi:hypothetical protein
MKVSNFGFLFIYKINTTLFENVEFIIILFHLYQIVLSNLY